MPQALSRRVWVLRDYMATHPVPNAEAREKLLRTRQQLKMVQTEVTLMVIDSSKYQKDISKINSRMKKCNNQVPPMSLTCVCPRCIENGVKIGKLQIKHESLANRAEVLGIQVRKHSDLMESIYNKTI